MERGDVLPIFIGYELCRLSFIFPTSKNWTGRRAKLEAQFVLSATEQRKREGYFDHNGSEQSDPEVRKVPKNNGVDSIDWEASQYLTSLGETKTKRGGVTITLAFVISHASENKKECEYCQHFL